MQLDLFNIVTNLSQSCTVVCWWYFYHLCTKLLKCKIGGPGGTLCGLGGPCH